MTDCASATTEICNKLGLHIRPSRKLASLVKSYDATVTIRNGDREADALSQLDLLMLVAQKGTTLTIEAKGPDSQVAVDAIVELIENRFGEAS